MYTLFRHKIFNGSRTREAYFSGNGVFCYLSGAFSIFFFAPSPYTFSLNFSSGTCRGSRGAIDREVITHFCRKIGPHSAWGGPAPPRGPNGPCEYQLEAGYFARFDQIVRIWTYLFVCAFGFGCGFVWKKQYGLENMSPFFFKCAAFPSFRQQYVFFWRTRSSARRAPE